LVFVSSATQNQTTALLSNAAGSLSLRRSTGYPPGTVSDGTTAIRATGAGSRHDAGSAING
jgi:hypothetical protein